jgi:hypothetical protein
MTNTTNHRIDTGTRVAGTYLGTPFTGTVRSHRGHTINWQVFMTHVDLDAPIDITAIGRTESDSVLVHTAWDGSALPADAGDWGQDTITVLLPGASVEHTHPGILCSEDWCGVASPRTAAHIAAAARAAAQMLAEPLHIGQHPSATCAPCAAATLGAILVEMQS